MSAIKDTLIDIKDMIVDMDLAINERPVRVMTNDGIYPIKQIVSLPHQVLVLLDDGSEISIDRRDS